MTLAMTPELRQSGQTVLDRLNRFDLSKISDYDKTTIKNLQLFLVTLCGDQNQNTQDSVALQASAKTERPFKVLVIDDDEDSQIVLKFFLEKHKLTLHSVTDAKQAVKKAIEVQPDIILLDLMMPEVSGFEVLQQIKATAAISHIPVIIGSSRSYTKDRLQCLELGAVDFVEKPYDLKELYLRLHKALK